MKELSFSEKSLIREFMMRGEVMSMCADLEMALLRILIYCLVETPEETLNNFRKMTMEFKIKIVKKYLKILYSSEYQLNKNYINKLSGILNFRNKVAHNVLTWNEAKKDLNYFYFTIISVIKGEERFYKIKMTTLEFREKVEIIRKTGMIFSKLADKIQNDFNHKYPNFINLSMV